MAITISTQIFADLVVDGDKVSLTVWVGDAINSDFFIAATDDDGKTYDLQGGGAYEETAIAEPTAEMLAALAVLDRVREPGAIEIVR